MEWYSVALIMFGMGVFPLILGGVAAPYAIEAGRVQDAKYFRRRKDMGQDDEVIMGNF